jgi:hypothetical protein
VSVEIGPEYSARTVEDLIISCLLMAVAAETASETVSETVSETAMEHVEHG